MIKGTRVIGCNDWRYTNRTGVVVADAGHAVIVVFDDGVTEYVRKSVVRPV
jgi:hypothetical protein